MIQVLVKGFRVSVFSEKRCDSFISKTTKTLGEHFFECYIKDDTVKLEHFW